MKYLLEKDKKKRISFLLSENLSTSLEFLSRFQDKIDGRSVGQIVKKRIRFHKKQFGKCYAKNRCIFTNRSRSIYRMGRISRIKFRSYTSSGYLTGVQKSSW